MPDIIFQCLQYIQYKQFIQYIQYLQYFTKEWNTIYTIQWLCISKTDREPVLFYVRGSCKITRTTNGQSLSEVSQKYGTPFYLKSKYRFPFIHYKSTRSNSFLHFLQQFVIIWYKYNLLCLWSSALVGQTIYTYIYICTYVYIYIYIMYSYIHIHIYI